MLGRDRRAETERSEIFIGRIENEERYMDAFEKRAIVSEVEKVNDDLPVDDSVRSSHLRNETEMQLITFDEGNVIRTNKYFQNLSKNTRASVKEANIIKSCLN